MPKVSVIIPCYNQAGYLPDAVGSVLAQTYRDFEIIIVNDGSTDNTRAAAEALIERHQDVCIRLVDQENRGLPGARNSGILAASGEYILPLDADDMLAPEYLSATVPVLDNEPGISIAYTDVLLFGDVPPGEQEKWKGQEYDFYGLVKHNRLPVCGLFRKKAWEDAGGYKDEMSHGFEDWEFWITLGELGHAGRFVPGRLFMYRLRPGSMFHGSNRMRASITRQIRDLHPGLYYPGLCGISPALARAAIWARYALRDLPAGYVRRNMPALYSLFQSMRGRRSGKADAR